jgi:acylphosphatase
MIKHLNISVSGKVQGVFFRASTKEKADEFNIKGFVRNERDGSVYIEAEATEASLKVFTEWCKQGPPHAKVLQSVVTEGAVVNYSSFEIRR